MVTRTYVNRIGRPKGTKNSTGYRLSNAGLKAKQKCMKSVLAQACADGKMGQHLKGREQSLEHRRKNSAGVKRAIAEGRFNPRANVLKYVLSDRFEPRSNHGVHGMFYSKKNDKHFRFDSSWELSRMMIMDSDDNDIVAFSKNPIRLGYKLNGERHYYWPDFLIEYKNGDRVLEEIKPDGLSRTLEAKEKFRVADIYCEANGMKFRVLRSILELALFLNCCAIVRSYGKKNRKKSAEMTGSRLVA